MGDAVDRDWLEWARPIVRIREDNPSHFAWCEHRLGCNQYTDLDATLRWPGYVGAEWQIGKGILFVGSVHSDFRGTGNREARTPIVKDLADANAKWRSMQSPSADEDRVYLDATREAYEALIPHWPRAETFRDLMTRVFGDRERPFSHAAWTNLAHCRSKPKAIREYPLQLRCSSEAGEYPISDLIRRLWPAAILVSVKPVGTAYRHRYDLLGRGYRSQMPDGYSGPLLRIFPGMLEPTWQGTPAGVWIPELASELLER